MAIDIVLDSIVQEEDGRISMTVKVVDGVEKIKSITVDGKSMDEVQEKLRTRAQAIISKRSQVSSLRDTATAGLESVKAALGLKGAKDGSELH